MFEQTSRLAERLAASVSRRGFLGSLGGWAAAAALGVAGVLTGTGTARADKPCTKCFYTCPSGSYFFSVIKGFCEDCPPSLVGCPFFGCENCNAVG